MTAAEHIQRAARSMTRVRAELARAHAAMADGTERDIAKLGRMDAELLAARVSYLLARLARTTP